MQWRQWPLEAWDQGGRASPLSMYAHGTRLWLGYAARRTPCLPSSSSSSSSSCRTESPALVKAGAQALKGPSLGGQISVVADMTRNRIVTTRT